MISGPGGCSPAAAAPGQTLAVHQGGCVEPGGDPGEDGGNRSGSAILGFAAVTGEKDRISLARRFVRHGEVVRPDPARAAFYAEKMKQYRRFRAFIMQEEQEKGNIS